MSRKWAAVAACALAMSAGATFVAMTEAAAQDRRVRVINNTSRTMVMLQASNVARRTWEENVLGGYVLRPGQATMSNINDGTGACLFDLRATFAGNIRAVRRNVNVCRVRSWTITD
jgi:hypothetical protein